MVSPSSPMAGLVPHRFAIGCESLEKMGFKIKIAKNALKVTDYTAGSAKERADDINEMFADMEVKAIMSTIGGFHSNQIINFLDYKMIELYPKIFIGFSDITVLHFALHTQCNMVTFYGPALLTQFGDSFGVFDYTQEYFKKALMQVEPIGQVKSSSEWTDESPDWFLKKDRERPRIMKNNEGFIWIKPGHASGKTIGGCITSMMHLRGTKFWPSFKKKIFFWELPESSYSYEKGEPLARVESFLTDFMLSGVFDAIAGMVVGRPKGYNNEEFQKLAEIIKFFTKDFDFPVLYNVDIGHTDPIMTLPIGVRVNLDSRENSFEISEAAVK